MENTNNNYVHCTTEAASPAGHQTSSLARTGQALPLDILAPCLADLKRQIALRQAMP